MCIKCNGKGFCGKPCKILNQFNLSIPRATTHFSGPTPPEIFVGRVGYPNVNMGILAPTSFETKHSEFNNAEQWSKGNLAIPNILRLRSQLVFGESNVNIKMSNNIKKTGEELAMTKIPTSTEFFLKKKPYLNLTTSSVFKPIMNQAQAEKINLQENVKIEKKVDYLVNDDDCKATVAINELYNSKYEVDHLQKILSVGLLGRKMARRMVPTRWSITAVDDNVCKFLMEKIRYYDEINEIFVKNGNYLGNYIEILFLPGEFSFDAIEAWYSDDENIFVYTEDYESFFGRKTYASNITGGYYAMRLPVCEYLENRKKQASVFVFRKILPEYYAPLGVGIVRETTRRAISSEEQFFDSIDEALNDISKRVDIDKKIIKEKSWLLNNYGRQKKLKDFFY